LDLIPVSRLKERTEAFAPARIDVHFVHQPRPKSAMTAGALVAAATAANGSLAVSLCADPRLDWLVLDLRSPVPAAAVATTADGGRLVDCRAWRSLPRS